MTTLTIPHSQHGITSLSGNCDVNIKFINGNKYAVLIPSYYTINNVMSMHRTEHCAAKAANKLSRQGYDAVTVLDADGNSYFVGSGNDGELVLFSN